MSTATTPDLSLPRLGRGVAAEGRRAALRSLNAHLNTMEGDILADLDRVQRGNAPQEFKDAFETTLRDLCAALDTTDQTGATR